MKIYCFDCAHFVSALSADDTNKCYAPMNIRHYDTWLWKCGKPKKHPKRLNKNNNCIWYKEKT